MEIIRRTGSKSKDSRGIQWTIPIEPEPYSPTIIKKRICVFDTETDPFAVNRVVKPFTCGFYLTDTDEYFDFWGDDCIDQFFRFLKANYADQELLILVHNGGNFDFYFFVDEFDSGHKPFIINGRLVRIMAGGQEFRDSYSMIPVPLGSYDKIKVTNNVPVAPEYEKKRQSDYDIMERWGVCNIKTRVETTCREFFKETIRTYQKRDCTSLSELVTQWFEMFGDKMTMASVALPMLRSYHGFEQLNETLDQELRPYYFGGRNQCFATGILTGDWKVYDIKSSYPDTMSRLKHPISDAPRYEPRITERTHFAKIKAWSLGALPIRKDDGGLDFPIGTYDFFACIHEIRAGLETGTLKILKVYHTIYFDEETNFAEFIDTFFKLRSEADAQGDEVRKLFYKLVMNSSYGKFAQDPRKYENWLFDPDEIPTPLYCHDCHTRVIKKEAKIFCASCDEVKSHSPYGWYLHTIRDDRMIYASPQRVRGGSFFNVATAASITSGARATLLRGIQKATRPIYCDTDSIICEHLEEGDGVVLDDKKLGAWNMEAKGDTAAIAGKKLYAIFDAGNEIKKASKGVKLTAKEILRVCQGEVIEYAHPVPKFKLNGEAQFTTRNIRATGIML